MKEQARNKRNIMSYKGENATEASLRLGGSKNLICQRVQLGWNIHRAFTKKLQ